MPYIIWDILHSTLDRSATTAVDKVTFIVIKYIAKKKNNLFLNLVEVMVDSDSIFLILFFAM